MLQVRYRASPHIGGRRNGRFPARRSGSGAIPRIGMREAGLVLAVLAIWLQSLLAPMHQISRTVTELRLSGHETGVGWTICTATGETDDKGRPIYLCPGASLCGGGLLPPAAPPFSTVLRLAGKIVPAALSQLRTHRTVKGNGRPRAPPDFDRQERAQDQNHGGFSRFGEMRKASGCVSTEPAGQARHSFHDNPEID
ncbi:MAG: hypothetical protein ACOYJQ_12325 [Pseudochelatococcus sp.]|jgi:hypothetical protein|uniref:hypothetical protein n=1 Tax=Pseudochelatococcus sp. TaxID=2020869 RepID=UPI003D8DAC76